MKETRAIYIKYTVINPTYWSHIKFCPLLPKKHYNDNRLLYEYGEILTRVSIAVTRACECHANANECQYFSISYNNIFIIRLDHSNIMDDILTSKFAVVISSKLASCL